MGSNTVDGGACAGASAHLLPAAMLANLRRRMFAVDPVRPRLGRYEIVRVLGEGAFGLVYEAEDPKLERRLAIKVLRGSAGDDTLAEARAIARISHPNVVTVYEVGTTEAGDVFLAMELVQGGTLRAWEQETRTTGDRLRAYIAAGRGLAAIHAANVVHGDFKPENVLVSTNGQVKVVDFGLARIRSSLGEEREVGTPASTTETTVMGTPAYMAPEQHRGKGVDARADQFAFCVSLYQSVHGQHPFPTGDYAALVRAMETGNVPRLRRGKTRTPGWLSGALARGMSPAAGDRFATMDELLDVLERDRGRPWRRAGVVALAATTLAAGYLARPEPHPEPASCDALARRQQEVWSPERRVAVQNKLADVDVTYARPTAERVANHLDQFVDTWSEVQTSVCSGNRTNDDPAKFALRVQCLDHRLSDLDALLQVLSDPDAEMIAVAVEATSHLRPPSSCIDPVGSVAPPPADTASEVARVREHLRRATVLREASRADEALRLARRLDGQAARLGYAPLRAETKLEIGYGLWATGEYGPAAQVLERATYLGDGSGHHEIALLAAALRLGVLGYWMEKVDDALEWRTEIESLVEKAGQQSIAAAHYHNDLGNVFLVKTDYEGALASYQRSLAIAEASLPARSPDVARELGNIANVLEIMGQLDQAVAFGTRAHDAFVQSLGEGHPLTALVLHNLALAKERTRDFATARAQQTEAVRRWTAGLGADHPFVGHGHVALATLDLAENRAHDAMNHAELACSILESSLAPDHTRLAWARAVRAEVRLALGDAERALQEIREPREILAKSGEPRPAARSALTMARAIVATDGDTARAQQIVDQAKERLAGTKGYDALRHELEQFRTD